MLAPSDGDFVLHAGAPATAATKRIVVTGLIDVVALMYITPRDYRKTSISAVISDVGRPGTDQRIAGALERVSPEPTRRLGR
jgi:hypothetical protein